MNTPHKPRETLTDASDVAWSAHFHDGPRAGQKHALRRIVPLFIAQPPASRYRMTSADTDNRIAHYQIEEYNHE